AYDEKEAAFDDAPFGVVGLETAFAVAHTELVESGLFTLPQLIRRMSTDPARVFHLPGGGGTLGPGSVADVAGFDTPAKWAVDPAAVHSKSRNTPFPASAASASPRASWTYPCASCAIAPTSTPWCTRIRLPLQGLPLRARRFRAICCRSLSSWWDRCRSCPSGCQGRRSLASASSHTPQPHVTTRCCWQIMAP